MTTVGKLAGILKMYEQNFCHLQYREDFFLGFYWVVLGIELSGQPCQTGCELRFKARTIDRKAVLN